MAAEKKETCTVANARADPRPASASLALAAAVVSSLVKEFGWETARIVLGHRTQQNQWGEGAPCSHSAGGPILGPVDALGDHNSVSFPLRVPMRSIK